MKSYDSAVAFRNALDDRVKSIARARGLSIMRCRKELVFDRLLARLVHIAPGQWMLKGAVALEFRFKEGTRTSLDVDIEGFNTIDEVDSVLQRAAELDLDDFFFLEIERTATVTSPVGSQLATYHVLARVGGAVFDEVRADVQLGRRQNIKADSVKGPDYLAFIGKAPIDIPTLPLSIQVAEKLHAFTRTYQRGNPSTRIKDLIDLVVISSRNHAEISKDKLAQDIARTFTERGTHDLPTSLPSPPSNWAVGYRREAREVGVPDDLRTGHELAAALIDPALQTLRR